VRRDAIPDFASRYPGYALWKSHGDATLDVAASCIAAPQRTASACRVTRSCYCAARSLGGAWRMSGFYESASTTIAGEGSQNI
jgi:hypothetical protein